MRDNSRLRNHRARDDIVEVRLFLSLGGKGSGWEKE